MPLLAPSGSSYMLHILPTVVVFGLGVTVTGPSRSLTRHASIAATLPYPSSACTAASMPLR